MAFRSSIEVRNALQQAADADQRTLSSMLAKITADWCSERGLLHKQEAKVSKSTRLTD